MKKSACFICCFIFFVSVTFAQDVAIDNFVPENEALNLKGRIEFNENGEILLNDEDTDKNEIKLSLPKAVKATSLSEVNSSKTTVADKQAKISDFYSTFWSKSEQSVLNSKRNGCLSYGSYFENVISDTQMEYRTKFYTRYDTKKFALTTALGQDQYITSGNFLNYFYITPEYKLKHGFVLKDAFKISTIGRRKNEIILQYNPKTKTLENNLNFELGVGQTTYESNRSVYHFKFATTFRL